MALPIFKILNVNTHRILRSEIEYLDVLQQVYLYQNIYKTSHTTFSKFGTKFVRMPWDISKTAINDTNLENIMSLQIFGFVQMRHTNSAHSNGDMSPLRSPISLITQ